MGVASTSLFSEEHQPECVYEDVPILQGKRAGHRDRPPCQLRLWPDCRGEMVPGGAQDSVQGFHAGR
ncbi:hypothetical protein ASF87_10260 [Microbacterium sp. Leaf161]|nr:hypothetical protein ASF87_10260 [Microbacterium sp. Leaf161]